MTGWKTTKNIKPMLRQASGDLEDGVPASEVVPRYGAQLATMLDELGEDFQHLAVCFRRIKTKRAFNAALNRLYDLADEKHVWLGL